MNNLEIEFSLLHNGITKQHFGMGEKWNVFVWVVLLSPARVAESGGGAQPSSHPSHHMATGRYDRFLDSIIQT